MALDDEAAAAIERALEECAARSRAAEAAIAQGGDAAADAVAADPAEPFVRIADAGDPYLGALIPPVGIEDFVPFAEGEADWRLAGAQAPDDAIAEVKRAKPPSNWKQKRA